MTIIWNGAGLYALQANGVWAAAAPAQVLSLDCLAIRNFSTIADFHALCGMEVIEDVA